MCQYRYSDYESVMKERQYCSSKDFMDLPLDKDGLCIFHSQDIEWKRQQNFVKWLAEYRDVLIEKKELINFSEFHFIAGQDKGFINYLYLLGNADLLNSTFHDIILCNDMTVQEGLDFKHCTFHSVMRFKDCNFEKDIKFTEIDVLDHSQIPLIVFMDCKSIKKFQYVHNQRVKMNLSFQRCEINSMEIRDISNEQEFGVFDITKCIIKAFDLRDCILYNCDFTDTKFYSADIYNVAFREETVFERIEVENHLKFFGGDDCSIFEGITRFKLDYENLQGQISFQNATLSSFLKHDKEKLLDYERRENGRIEIGSGCIKYRIVSDDIVYPLKDSHQHFITEVGQAFSSFFTQYNGFNLGIDVRKKTKTDITIFYFTDDNIDKKEFIKMIGDTSARTFGVNNLNIEETSAHHDALINYQLDLLRSFTKIAYQIHKKNWMISDSKTFFNALNLSPNIYLDEKSTHAFLEKINFNEILKTLTGLSVNVNQDGPNNTFIGVVNSKKTTITERKNKSESCD